MDNAFSQLLRNLAASFAAKLFLRALGFVVFVFQTSHLGPADFGAFVLILSYVSMLLMFVDLGWSTVIVREIGRDPSSAPRHLANYFAFQTLSSPLFAVGLVVFAIIAGYPGDQMRLIAAGAVGVVFGGLYKAPAGALIARQRADAAVLVETVANLAASLAALAAVWLGCRLLVFVWIYNIYYAGLFFGALYMARRLIGPVRWSVETGLWRASLRQGFVCALMAAGYALYTTIDVAALSRLRSNMEDVGIYGVAIRMTAPLMLFVEAIMLGVFPLQAARQGDAPAFRFLLNKAIKALSAIGLPIALGLTLLSPHVIASLFPEYGPASTTLSILVWRIVFLFVCAAINFALTAGGQLKTLAAINASAVVVNLILCKLLIPRYGANGAAMASLSANAWVLLVQIAGRGRFYHFAMAWGDVARIAAGLALMAATLLGLGCIPPLAEGIPGLLIRIAAGAFVYLGALLSLGFIGHEERPYLEREWRRLRGN